MTMGKHWQSFQDLAQDTCSKEGSLACSFALPSSVGAWEGHWGKGQMSLVQLVDAIHLLCTFLESFAL